MKPVILFAAFIFFSSGIFSQENSFQTKIKEDIEKDCEKLRDRLQKDFQKGRIEHEAYIDLEVDMFRIDEYVRKNLERNASSLNYVTLLIEAEHRYQELVENYYNALLKKISEADRKNVEAAQASWKLWQANEKVLNKTINDSKYNPTAADLEVSAEHFLNLAKDRAMDLMDYIVRTKGDDPQNVQN